MATVDVTRIAGNIGALTALNSLNTINSELATHQTRLASGKAINESADDPAGLSMATTFDIQRQGLQTVLNGIGDGKNLLSTAEGGLSKIQDILVKMKSKALEGQSGTIGTSEKQAIVDQLNAYTDEIDSIVEQTSWNGTNLIGSSGSAGGTSNSTALLTSLGEVDSDGVTQGTTSSFSFANHQGFGAFGSGTSGLGLVGATESGDDDEDGTSDGIVHFTVNDLTTEDTLDADGKTALDKITDALDKVKTGISNTGAWSARLSFKEEAITVQQTNTESAYNRIMNADMASEQVEASKLTILQQTATAMLAQANTAPQFLLSLFQ